MSITKTWKSILVILLFAIASHSGQAQSLAQQGTSVEDLVPAGWLHQEAQGDLNKDGILDLVVVATPDYEENTLTREDGYVYNFNQPILDRSALLCKILCLTAVGCTDKQQNA